MYKIAGLPNNERTDLFQETASRRGMTATIVEKDFWVCWALGKIFSDPQLSRIIMFKGGTSLSKVFGIIDRFSEDIDIILNWETITQENPMEPRSKTKQIQLNDELQLLSQNYIRENFIPHLEKCFEKICKVELDKDDKNSVSILYPAAFPSAYVRPEIKLEIGPLAIWIPNSEYEISSYAAQEFPDQFENPTCRVHAIKAERTFWEKVTILHHEAHRPQENPQPPRYSRHYYDLAMMAKSDVKKSALSNFDLLQSVVESKIRFYPRSWARYDLAKPGTLKLLPPQHLLDQLRRDYTQMEMMIFGNRPSFQEIMDQLKKLEDDINR